MNAQDGLREAFYPASFKTGSFEIARRFGDWRKSLGLTFRVHALTAAGNLPHVTQKLARVLLSMLLLWFA
jgi:hypothetical protein